MQDVKLRLGSINSGGEQKEVDSLLVTDLIDLARNQSICNATVVTGDSDVRIAVQIAQSFGVRVHLVGIEPSRGSQAALLRQEADTVHEITKGGVSRFLAASALAPREDALCAADPALTGAPQAAPIIMGAADRSNKEVQKTLEQILEEAIQRTLSAANPEDIRRLSAALSVSSQTPTEYDSRLLGTCRTLLGRDLMGEERREMRTAFKREILRLGALES